MNRNRLQRLSRAGAAEIPGAKIAPPEAFSGIELLEVPKNERVYVIDLDRSDVKAGNHLRIEVPDPPKIQNEIGEN